MAPFLSDPMPIITPTSQAAWSFPADSALSILDFQELAQQCAYRWTVETRFHGPTDTRGSRISAAFVGSRKGRKSYGYRHALNSTENHVAAAVEWLQQLSSQNGAPSYALMAKASTSKGYVFTFG